MDVWSCLADLLNTLKRIDTTIVQFIKKTNDNGELNDEGQCLLELQSLIGPAVISIDVMYAILIWIFVKMYICVLHLLFKLGLTGVGFTILYYTFGNPGQVGLDYFCLVSFAFVDCL